MNIAHPTSESVTRLASGTETCARGPPSDSASEPLKSRERKSPKLSFA
jgi:hypothetical protein